MKCEFGKSGRYEAISLGADGQAGGEGENEDVRCWAENVPRTDCVCGGN